MIRIIMNMIIMIMIIFIFIFMDMQWCSSWSLNQVSFVPVVEGEWEGAAMEKAKGATSNEKQGQEAEEEAQEEVEEEVEEYIRMKLVL